MNVMKIYISLFALVLTVLCGCGTQQQQQHYTSGQGDVGQFILQTAERFGGVPLATNGLPRISDQWSYSEDTNGVVIMLSKQAFPALVDFLRQSFGPPPGSGDSGREYSYWLWANHHWGDNHDANLKLHQWDTNTEVDILWHQRPNYSMMQPNNPPEPPPTAVTSPHLRETLLARRG
jgi:hypothetical protein